MKKGKDYSKLRNLTLPCYNHKSRTQCGLASQSKGGLVNLGLSNAFLMFVVLGFAEEDHRSKVPFLTCSLDMLWYQHDLSLMWTLITWIKLCLPCFNHKVTWLPNPFHTLLFGNKSLNPAHTPRGRVYINNLEFFCKEVCLSHYLFIQLFIYVSMDYWIFIL